MCKNDEELVLNADWLVCDDCGKRKEDVRETFCPYAAEINDDPDVEITVCDDCYSNRADDI